MHQLDQSRFQQTPQALLLNQDGELQTHHLQRTQHPGGQYETATALLENCHQVQHLQIYVNNIKNMSSTGEDISSGSFINTNEAQIITIFCPSREDVNTTSIIYSLLSSLLLSVHIMHALLYILHNNTCVACTDPQAIRHCLFCLSHFITFTFILSSAS